MKNPFRAAAAATALLAGLPTIADADVFKCTGAGGVVTYQDVPCRNARTEEKLPLEPATVSAEDLAAARDAAAILRQQDKELAERLQRDTDSRRELAAATPPPVYTEPEPVDDPRETSRTIVLPYQPGVWRDGVYYPSQYGLPQSPVGRADDDWHRRLKDDRSRQDGAGDHDNRPRHANAGNRPSNQKKTPFSVDDSYQQ